MNEGLKLCTDIVSKSLSGFILPILVDLRIAEKLLLGPKSTTDLIEDASINPDRLHRYLLQLESNGMFSFDQHSKKWSNTPQSSDLTSEITRSFVRSRLARYRMEEYLHLDEVLHSHRTVYEILEKNPHFDELNSNPERLLQFQTHMRGSTMANIEELVQAIDLNQSTRALDIGGGDGTLVIHLVKKYSHITGAVLERAEVAELARKYIEENGVTEKVQAIVGDFIESLPKGFDAVVLKHILHDWKDQECSGILKNCRNAMQPGDKIFVVDSVVEKNSEFYQRTMINDITMMMHYGSKERTAEEIQNLLEEAGFAVRKISPALFNSVIEAIAI